MTKFHPANPKEHSAISMNADPAITRKEPTMDASGLKRQKDDYQPFPDWLSEDEIQARLVSREGVSAATLLENNIHKPSFLEIRSIWGFDAPGFILPYYDLDGNPVIDEGMHKPKHITFHKDRKYGRIRFDKPTYAKYLQVKETTTHLYYPKGLADLDCSDLVIIEGEIKALSLFEEGIPAIGIGGFYGISRAKALNPELAYALKRLRVKRIYFLGDSDTAHNYQFAHASKSLADWVDPIPVVLPRIPLSQSKGIDDVKADLGPAFIEFWKKITEEAMPVSRETTASALSIELIEKEMSYIAAVPEGEEHKMLFRRFVYAGACFQEEDAPKFDSICDRAGFDINQIDKGIELARKTFGDKNRSKAQLDADKAAVEALYNGKCLSSSRTSAPPPSKGKGKSKKTALKDLLFLPSKFTTHPDSAQLIYTRLAGTSKFYRRGRKVLQLEQEAPNQPLSLIPFTPDMFISRLANYGILARWKTGNNSSVKFPDIGAILRKEESTALLEALQVDVLPYISCIHNSPIIVSDGSEVKVLGAGYHSEAGGHYVVQGAAMDIPLQDAIQNINEIISEFDFSTPADKSRAICALLTPALKFGAIAKFHSPLFVVEADKSQAGKGYYIELIQNVYGETPSILTQAKGGVGSFDESLATLLVNGRPFIQLDNFRGDLDSKTLEAILTCPPGAMISCRTPNFAAINIDPSPYIFHISSNGFNTTKDLVNRSCLIQIHFRDNYEFKEYPEGDLQAHISKNRAKYIGSVFAIIKEWNRRGMPHTKSTAAVGRFRRWWQASEYIITEIFKETSPIEDHSSLQKRLSNSTTSWLRVLIIDLIASGKGGQKLTTLEISDFCGSKGIYPAGKNTMSAMYAGRLLGEVFEEKSFATLEDKFLEKIEEQVFREEKKDTLNKSFYRFGLIADQKVEIPVDNSLPPSGPTDPSDQISTDDDMLNVPFEDPSFSVGKEGKPAPILLYATEVSDALSENAGNGKVPQLFLDIVKEMSYSGVDPSMLRVYLTGEGIPESIAMKAITICEHLDMIVLKDGYYYPLENGRIQYGYPGQPFEPQVKAVLDDRFAISEESEKLLLLPEIDEDLSSYRERMGMPVE